MTTVAVIGAGNVGRALGSGLARAGHQVAFGVRGPDDSRYGDLPAVEAPHAATEKAEVVVLAVPATAVVGAVGSLGLRSGQLLIDATNAVGTPIPEGYATMGDLVAAHIPEEVALVKAFNTIGAEHLGDGRFGDQRAFLPVAGDDAGIDVVVPLAEALGFAAAPLGGREAFGMVEDHARLWIHLAFVQGWGREFGFTVVGR